MLRGLERRLRRLEERFASLAAERDHERDVLRARKIIAQAIRTGLAHAGIDPETAPALRRFEQPDPPHPQTAGQPAGGDGGPLDVFYGRLSALARRYRDKPPDLTNASPAMLFAAYCMGDATPSPS